MAIDPHNAPVEIVKKQDVADSEHLRMTTRQAEALLRAPGLDTLRGLRDSAILALALCTGIRQGELRNVRTDDLRQHLGGRLALRIRRGKGAKARLIPYGQLDWCLAVVDALTDAAGIESGAVFRPFWKGSKRTRPDGFNDRSNAIGDILNRYPIMIDGELRTVNPHDLRRTYAFLAYQAGVDLLAISQNLGHATTQTTLKYINTSTISRQAPKFVFKVDFGSNKP